jgi:hypothetical protein
VVSGDDGVQVLEKIGGGLPGKDEVNLMSVEAVEPMWSWRCWGRVGWSSQRGRWSSETLSTVMTSWSLTGPGREDTSGPRGAAKGLHRDRKFAYAWTVLAPDSAPTAGPYC